jgi:hypothetical protein
MQKASVGLERAKEAEKELKKEQKRAEKAEKESAQHAQLLKAAREEAEGLRRDNTELRAKAEEVERAFRQQLADAEAKAEAEYDRAVDVITDNYKAQMPAVQDAVWGAAWRRCLTKLGVDPSSPHWTEMELPSEVAIAYANSDAGAQPDPEVQPEPVAEQILPDEAITDLTIVEGDVAGALRGDNLVPHLAADAGQHSEEA